MPHLTHNEVIQASIALANWFQSQDIKPSDAIGCMAVLIAALAVEKTKDVNNLQVAIKAVNSLIVLEIAEALRTP